MNSAWSARRVADRKSGGPLIAAEPAGQGFGRTLTRDMILRQFEETFAFDWREQGLVADFVLPLEKLTR
jgi:hypothetical protein